MAIPYIGRDASGLEMDDRYEGHIGWHCSGCDITFCDVCVKGKWVTRTCSGGDYSDRTETTING